MTSQFCISARVRDPYAGERTWTREELESTLGAALRDLHLQVDQIQVITPSLYTEEPQ